MFLKEGPNWAGVPGGEELPPFPSVAAFRRSIDRKPLHEAAFSAWPDPRWVFHV